MPDHPLAAGKPFRCSYYPACRKTFKRQNGLTYHVRSRHSSGNKIQSPSPSPSNQRRAPSPLLNNDTRAPNSPPPIPPPSDHPIPDNRQTQSPGTELHGDQQPNVNHRSQRNTHPHLDGKPCDRDGNYLPPGSVPPPRIVPDRDDWTPFGSRQQFELADLLFRKVEMSAGNVDELFNIWGLSNDSDDEDCTHSQPFVSHKDMYSSIDEARVGDAPWRCLSVSVAPNADPAEGPIPEWKTKSYEVWYRNPLTVLRNMLDNPDFDGEFDYAPYVQLDHAGQRRWGDFMSANFAWRQSTKIADENPEQNDGCLYCSVILGSDKTTVSVATGQVEYHPLYMSIGNIHNSVRRSHRQGVIPIAFLAIPKADRRFDNDPSFRKFKRQLYHTSLSAIFKAILPYMSSPIVLRCPDGHYRRVIFDFGPFLGDYPEQVMLTGIVQNWCSKCMSLCTDLDDKTYNSQRSRPLTDFLIESLPPLTLWDEYGIDADIIPFTNDFPRADIHQLIAPDLLHQIIKGTFKDHLVSWVWQYLTLSHGDAEAKRIMDLIDQRLAVVPMFPGLRRFPQGRRFKQWTGNDSKALMKIFIPSLVGLVPDGIIKTFQSFLDFCYLARRSSFSPSHLDALEEAVNSFHQHREVFREEGVRPEGFSIPRIHSMVHYRHLIQEFGAPNGLCTSITESRHITAVKKPWRRSSRWEALGQMLRTNQRLDKLAALRAQYIARMMLPPAHDMKHPPRKPKPTVNGVPADEDDDEAPLDDTMVEGHVELARTRMQSYPRDIDQLGRAIGVNELHSLTRRFLYDHIYPHARLTANEVTLDRCPQVHSLISVFHSAVATFFAPSDLSGIHGMRRERIRSTPFWRDSGERRDCALVVEDQSKPGFLGMSVVRVRLFFSFKHYGQVIPCALVEWFKKINSRPDHTTGLWVVEPDSEDTGPRHRPLLSVVHLDSFFRAAHLIPVYGAGALPHWFQHTDSLSAFKSFYLNKYIDYHAFEVLS